jgi:glycolate oxidase
MPEAVVRVHSARDVHEAMRVCAEHEVAVTPRAGGTGRTGGAVPLAGGVVLAFEQMNQIKGIEVRDMIAVVEPGVILADLHAAVEAQGLFYPPDPNSLASCAIGGNVAENAGGPRALRYGCTRDYVLGLNVVTADGTALNLGKRTVKGVTGYDLTSLMVGSEGTLSVTTEITLKLLPKPQAVATLLAPLPSLQHAAHAVTAVLGQGILPRCMELMDEITLEMVRPDAGLPISERARALLLIELDGDESALDAQLERAGNALEQVGAIDVLVARHSGDRERLWAARRELSRALRRRAKHKLAEDVVVPRSQIPSLIERCRALSERYGVVMPCYGHAGDGNIHVNFLWDDPSDEPKVHQAIEGLFKEVIALGGTLSGEHGIGVLKAPYLPLEQSPALIAVQERVKAVFDPKGLLNPGKIFPAHLQRFHGAC